MLATFRRPSCFRLHVDQPLCGTIRGSQLRSLASCVDVKATGQGWRWGRQGRGRSVMFRPVKRVLSDVAQEAHTVPTLPLLCTAEVTFHATSHYCLFRPEDGGSSFLRPADTRHAVPATAAVAWTHSHPHLSLSLRLFVMDVPLKYEFSSERYTPRHSLWNTAAVPLRSHGTKALLVRFVHLMRSPTFLTRMSPPSSR
jgi:hypothetical protein